MQNFFVVAAQPVDGLYVQHVIFSQPPRQLPVDITVEILTALLFHKNVLFRHALLPHGNHLPIFAL